MFQVLAKSPCIMCIQYIGVPWVYWWISWVHRGDIMIHLGEQVHKSLWFILKTTDVLNIPQCYHDSPTYIMVSPNVLNIPWCTNGIPRCAEHRPMYWTHNIQFANCGFCDQRIFNWDSDVILTYYWQFFLRAYWQPGFFWEKVFLV